MFFSDCVEQNGKKLQNTSQNHKDMENGMHPLFSASDSVQDGSDGVGNSAGQKQQKSRKRKGYQRVFGEGDDCPAHTDIADHGEYLIHLQINGGKHCSEDYHGPFKDQNAPGDDGVQGADGGKQHNGVCSADQKIDRAVVNYLHYFFCHSRCESVVYAGNGVKGNHSGSVDGRCGNRVTVSADCGENCTEHQCCNGKNAAKDMGDGVDNLLTFGVIGK